MSDRTAAWPSTPSELPQSARDRAIALRFVRAMWPSIGMERALVAARWITSGYLDTDPASTKENP